MITIQEAFKSFLLAKGDGFDYRCNKIHLVKADKNRNTGGEFLTLNKARILGKYQPPFLGEKKIRNYRKKQCQDFYDEATDRTYRVHLDLILSINDLEIA